jgi:hypothetical protein
MKHEDKTFLIFSLSGVISFICAYLLTYFEWFRKLWPFPYQTIGSKFTIFSLIFLITFDVLVLALEALPSSTNNPPKKVKAKKS